MDTKILLVDDARTLHAFARTLKLAHYAVITAEGREEGLALYEQAQPDVVLLDLGPSDEDGLAVLQAIREQDPEANVILCAGQGDRDVVIRALRAGASDFLPKPVDQAALEGAIRRAEERAHLKRELRASQEALRRQNEQLEEAVKAHTAERDRLDTILSALDTGLSLINPDMTIAWVNRRIHQMFPAEEPVGQRCHVFYEARDTVCENCGTLAAFRTGEIRVRERHNPSDGRWYTIISQPVRDGQGNVISVLEGITDITERKRMEEALQESEQRRRQAQQLARIGHWDWDVETNTLHWSSEVFDIFGQDPQQFAPTAESFEALIHPEDRDAFLAERARMLEAHDYANIQHRIAVPDGTVRHVQELAEVFRDARGEVTKVSGTVQDITERKRVEETLRRYTERLQALHEIDRAILAAESLEEIARVARQRAKPLLSCYGFSLLTYNADTRHFRVVSTEPEEGPGVSADVRLPAEPAMIAKLTRREPLLLEDLPTARISSEGRRLVAATGVQAALLVPLVVGRELIGVLALTAKRADVLTSQHEEVLSQLADSLAVALQQARLLEQTQRDVEAKATLLHEVNHRVLNNLTAILAILDIERQRSLSDEADFHAVLDDVTSRIDGMVTVHRMLSGVQWAPLDLGEVVERVIDAALSGSAIQHRIEVVVDAPDERLRVTSKQAIAMALVINELTTNSVKHAFCDRSRGRIHVQIAPLDEERAQLVFHDDGPGMPSDVLAGERRNVGLRLVETNVEHSLDGEIDFHNDDGAVATFTFERVPLT